MRSLIYIGLWVDFNKKKWRYGIREPYGIINLRFRNGAGAFCTMKK